MLYLIEFIGIFYLFDFIMVFLQVALPLGSCLPVMSLPLLFKGDSKLPYVKICSLVLLATSRLSPVCLVLDLPHMALYLHSYGMCVFFP